MTNTNAPVDKLLSDIFLRYKDENARLSKGSEIELEIRFKDITREAFISLYQHISTDSEFTNPMLECSVNAISENVFEKNIGNRSDNAQYIRKMIFNKGIMTSDIYMCKTRLMRPVHVNDYIKYSVGLAKEVKCAKFSTRPNAFIRMKTRMSFDYLDPITGGIKWRFDLTAVKSGKIESLGPCMKELIPRLFKTSLTPDTFLRELDFDQMGQYEIEVEHVGGLKTLSADDLAIVKKVFAMINPTYLIDLAYQEEIGHVARYIIPNKKILHLYGPTYKLKQLANQVIALNKTIYYSDIYPPIGYFATDKADGVRCIVSVNGNRCRILLSNGMREFQLGEALGGVTIADAELVERDSYFTLYLFDCMVLNGNDVSNSGFEVRCGHLAEAAAIIAPLVGDGNRCESKQFVTLIMDNLEEMFSAVAGAVRPYQKDGIIITAPGKSYAETKNYKWKPLEQNTIDFLAMKCPQKLLGKAPYMPREGMTLYLLFVGIDHKMRERLGLGFIPTYKDLFGAVTSNYYPVQFSPSLNPFAYLFYHAGDCHGKIVELGPGDGADQWKFHRIRTDRVMEKNYYGNDYRIAELTYINYINPFHLKDLWSPSTGYFEKLAGDTYTAANKFKRYVISMAMRNNMSGAKWVVDEAAGRGGDLHRYSEIGVENTLFIDVDPMAIAELIRRKFDISKHKKNSARDWFRDTKSGGSIKVLEYDRIHDVEYEKAIIKDVRGMTVHTLVADLKLPSGELIAKVRQFGLNTGIVDGVVCNFAFHYMCDTLEHMRELLVFNARMLKVGGTFMMTVMSGERVFGLLNSIPKGRRWESHEGETVKYAIQREYSGDKLSKAGQMISVMLPFSEEMYTEPLCNVDAVMAEAAKLGMKVSVNAPFGDFLEQFRRADKFLHDKMSPEDKDYVKLHQLLVFKKVSEPKVKK